jgi:hypothetical protein
MKVVVLDEYRKRSAQLAERFNNSNVDVVLCSTANEFMDVLYNGSIDKVLIDMSSWLGGKALYRYFNLGGRLENTPVVLYGAPSEHVAIANRPRHQADAVLLRQSTVDDIVAAAM